jgi:hypothetical protein
MTKSRLQWLTATLPALLMAAGSGVALAAAPDFKQARAEAEKILIDLVRIDTTNPPGNETPLVPARRHPEAADR